MAHPSPVALLGARCKAVQDHLRATHLSGGSAAAAADILRATGCDITADGELMHALMGAPPGLRAIAEVVQRAPDGTPLALRYLPRHPSVTDAASLAAFVARRAGGVYLDDLRDSYRGVDTDAKRLERDGTVMAVTNTDEGDQATALFPRLPLVRANTGRDASFDAHCVTALLNVALPASHDELCCELKRQGLRVLSQPLEAAATAKAPRQGLKRQRTAQLRTNAHLPDGTI